MHLFCSHSKKTKHTTLSSATMADRSRSPRGEVQEPDQEGGPEVEEHVPCPDPDEVSNVEEGLDLDMIFKAIPVNRLASNEKGDLLCTCHHKAQAQIFPERPHLISLCQQPFHLWCERPQSSGVITWQKLPSARG